MTWKFSKIGITLERSTSGRNSTSVFLISVYSIEWDIHSKKIFYGIGKRFRRYWQSFFWVFGHIWKIFWRVRNLSAGSVKYLFLEYKWIKTVSIISEVWKKISATYNISWYKFVTTLSAHCVKYYMPTKLCFRLLNFSVRSLFATIYSWIKYQIQN
mgnify:CR=1 FL=1